MMIAGLLLSLALADPAPAARVQWDRDYTRAYAEGSERVAPILMFFSGNACGVTSNPGATESRPGAGKVAGIDLPMHDTELNDCDLMQKDVWEATGVVAASQRFERVLVDSGDQTLSVKYQVIVNP